MSSFQKVKHSEKQERVTHTRGKKQSTETKQVQMLDFSKKGFKAGGINMLKELQETMLKI